jgi:hypothetical protein
LAEAIHLVGTGIFSMENPNDLRNTQLTRKGERYWELQITFYTALCLEKNIQKRLSGLSNGGALLTDFPSPSTERLLEMAATSLISVGMSNGGMRWCFYLSGSTIEDGGDSTRHERISSVTQRFSDITAAQALFSLVNTAVAADMNPVYLMIEAYFGQVQPRDEASTLYRELSNISLKALNKLSKLNIEQFMDKVSKLNFLQKATSRRAVEINTDLQGKLVAIKKEIDAQHSTAGKIYNFKNIFDIIGGSGAVMFGLSEMCFVEIATGILSVCGKYSRRLRTEQRDILVVLNDLNTRDPESFSSLESQLNPSNNEGNMLRSRSVRSLNEPHARQLSNLRQAQNGSRSPRDITMSNMIGQAFSRLANQARIVFKVYQQITSIGHIPGIQYKNVYLYNVIVFFSHQLYDSLLRGQSQLTKNDLRFLLNWFFSSISEGIRDYVLNLIDSKMDGIISKDEYNDFRFKYMGLSPTMSLFVEQMPLDDKELNETHKSIIESLAVSLKQDPVNVRQWFYLSIDSASDNGGFGSDVVGGVQAASSDEISNYNVARIMNMNRNDERLKLFMGPQQYEHYSEFVRTNQPIEALHFLLEMFNSFNFTESGDEEDIQMVLAFLDEIKKAISNISEYTSILPHLHGIVQTIDGQKAHSDYIDILYSIRKMAQDRINDVELQAQTAYPAVVSALNAGVVPDFNAGVVPAFNAGVSGEISQNVIESLQKQQQKQQKKQRIQRNRSNSIRNNSRLNTKSGKEGELERVRAQRNRFQERLATSGRETPEDKKKIVVNFMIKKMEDLSTTTSGGWNKWLPYTDKQQLANFIYDKFSDKTKNEKPSNDIIKRLSEEGLTLLKKLLNEHKSNI